ncbi:gamma carbonic anhydrase family protein [Robbsia sp. KACC 23696]|uniref:gamma carbonic anhydrase family protein n=1 Tax=Robbsia sp. KACC 23696 TaxID=3149231 RepID=UPI00325BFF04
MTIYRLGEYVPIIDETAFVAPGATVIGRVVLGPGVSVWPGAVLRGDNDLIEIGEGSNIQDGAILHVDIGHPLRIGRGVTIGHQVMLHGCTIADNVLVGIQSVVLNDAVIHENSLIGAASLLTSGKHFPPGVMVRGSPAQVVRELTPDEIEKLRDSAQSYRAHCAFYKENLARVG